MCEASSLHNAYMYHGKNGRFFLSRVSLSLPLLLMLSFSLSLTLSQRLERRLEVQLVDSAAEEYVEVRSFVSLTIRSDLSKFSLFHLRINLSSISLIIFQSHYLSLSLFFSLYALVMSLLISFSLSLYHTYKHTRNTDTCTHVLTHERTHADSLVFYFSLLNLQWQERRKCAQFS